MCFKNCEVQRCQDTFPYSNVLITTHQTIIKTLSKMSSTRFSTPLKKPKASKNTEKDLSIQFEIKNELVITAFFPFLFLMHNVVFGNIFELLKVQIFKFLCHQWLWGVGGFQLGWGRVVGSLWESISCLNVLLFCFLYNIIHSKTHILDSLKFELRKSSLDFFRFYVFKKCHSVSHSNNSKVANNKNYYFKW